MIQNIIIWSFVKGWTPIGSYYQDKDDKTIGYGASEIADWLGSDIQSLDGLDEWIDWISKADQGIDPGYEVGFGMPTWWPSSKIWYS